MSLLSLLLFSLLPLSSPFTFSIYNLSAAIELPSFSFHSASDCDCHKKLVHSNKNKDNNNILKLPLNHHPLHHPSSPSKPHSLSLAADHDLSRLNSIFTVNSKTPLPDDHSHRKNHRHDNNGRMSVTVQSGVSLGSGEYFINAFVGTPPKQFKLILDTGSDLNWIQCLPCIDCFEQHGPVFDPAMSSSYRNVSCTDHRCGLVTSPDLYSCDEKLQTPCQYFYWYGDRSNTTGDLALESFTVNLTNPDSIGADSHRVDDVIFGCGHWNRGLFHGAAGLLGLGRGPLSFASQLRDLYGQTFSYCLVDRNSDLSVSSKLIFGDDQSLTSHPNLNYTQFVSRKASETFYYIHVQSIKVGGELLKIPKDNWELTDDGAGGTIIDSGTTLSYFADSAYEAIRDAFMSKIKYPLVEDFPVLRPCYNVSGVERVEIPSFAIVFGDSAVWDFPVENYFIRFEPEEIMCMAILGTPRSSLSIIGNYQQQNFHMVYDTERSRLGFAPRRCAEV